MEIYHMAYLWQQHSNKILNVCMSCPCNFQCEVKDVLGSSLSVPLYYIFKFLKKSASLAPHALLGQMSLCTKELLSSSWKKRRPSCPTVHSCLQLASARTQEREWFLAKHVQTMPGAPVGLPRTCWWDKPGWVSMTNNPNNPLSDGLFLIQETAG